MAKILLTVFLLSIAVGAAIGLAWFSRWFFRLVTHMTDEEDNDV